MKPSYEIWLPALALLAAACQKDKATEPAAPVTAAFTMPAKAALSTAVAFQNQSQNATKYTWSFGDGGASQAPNPTYTYAAAGQYVVRLLAAGAAQTDSASVRQLITIEDDTPRDTTTVKAAFTAPAEGQRTVAVAFQNQSRGATAYAWVFGDGNGSQEQDPRHAYADTGAYVVKLYAFGKAKRDSTARVVRIR